MSRDDVCHRLMMPPDVVELTKQGDKAAIAALLSQAVRDQNIAIKVHLHEACLHILLEAELVPDQVKAVRRIRQWLLDLEFAIAPLVKIYGQQRGAARPTWTVSFEWVKSPATSSKTNRQTNQPPLPEKSAPLLQHTTPDAAPIFKIGSFTYTTNDLRNLLLKLNPLKVSFVIVLALYGLFGAPSYTVERFLEGSDSIMIFLHGVNLIFHEAGHVFFSFFGKFLHILGGSLMQVLIPAGIAGYFFFHRQLYAGAVTLCWVAQNLWDVSIYIKDAQARALPLLGGEAVLHDWHFLLLDMNLLTKDQLIGNLVFGLGVLLYLIAIFAGFYCSQVEIADDSFSEGVQ